MSGNVWMFSDEIDDEDLCLKQPLTCFLLSNYFQKTGRNVAT